MIRILALLSLLAVPLGARGQEPGSVPCVGPWTLGGAVDPLGAGPDQPELAYVDDAGRLCRTLVPDPAFQADPETLPSPGRAALFSALLPGMGQRYLDQGRWIAYLGIEIWAWIQFFDERAEGQALQDQYRDLAWDVARRVSSGPRVDGDFEYYESLTKFIESGAWDANPLAPGIQPETDPSTFNGSVWELAREIFFPTDPEAGVPMDSPAYRNALDYYQERGVIPAFTWSWSQNELQQAVYEEVIQQSDENLRNSTTMVGVIIANHVVSAVDALISARLRLRDPDALSIQLVPYPDRASDFGVVVRLVP